MTRPELPWHGQCQCGAIKFKITEYPISLYACHCTECQKISSSAFGISMPIPIDAIEVEGDTAVYVKGEGTPSEVHGHYCDKCGSRLYHWRPSRPQWAITKPGLLLDTSHLEIVAHLWTKRMQPWVELGDDKLIFETQPEDLKVLVDAYQERYPVADK